MDYLELQKRSLHKELSGVYKEITDDRYEVDVVFFLGKGGLYIGQYFSEKFNCPLGEILVARKEPLPKKILKNMFKFFPKRLLKKMRSFEINSGYHKVKTERFVKINRLPNLSSSENLKILIVDDSIDTGYSIKSALDILKINYKNSQIRIASLNVFKDSFKVITPNYYKYSNKAIIGPWSLDSDEYKEFIDNYNKWLGQG